MKKLALLIILTLFISNSKAQQHFIKTDPFGYFYSLTEPFYGISFQPKFSLGYERYSDSLNQSIALQASYGSIPAIAGETYSNLDTSMTLSNTFGFSLQPEYRYYLGNKQRKVRLFGNVGGMLFAGKVNQTIVLIRNDKHVGQTKSNSFALGVNMGGGVKYCFTKHLYSELLVDFGFPIYRTTNLIGLEYMFYRLELGVGYYFTKKK